MVLLHVLLYKVLMIETFSPNFVYYKTTNTIDIIDCIIGAFSVDLLI